MAFHLYSTGKLTEGESAQQAVAAIAKITGLTEAQVHTQLLNGQRRRLATDDDEGKVKKARDRLLAVGLAVEVVADMPAGSQMSEKERISAPDSPPALAPRRIAARIRNFTILVLAIVLVTTAAGWYWLNRPLSDAAIAIEEAVADGTLVAIGHIDVAKIVFIKSQWFGESDPNPIPISDEDQKLLERLFAGEANFRENLQHAFFAVHALGEQQGVENTLVLEGHFDDSAIRATLASDYRLEPLGEGRWSMVRLPKQVDGLRCPEQQPATPGAVAKPQYLHITPQWLLVSSSEAQAQHVQRRLANSDSAAQSLETWRSYRRGQLFSLMVFIPTEASKGVNGLPGMIARKASTDTPQVTGLAARIGLAPVSAGLRAGVKISSADAAWNREKASKLREEIAQWSQDNQGISPTLGQLLSRISVDETAEHLQIEANLDNQVLAEMGQIVQEVIGRLFSFKAVDSGKAKEPQADVIMNSPVDYAANTTFDRLPAYKTNSFSYPLFIHGGFAANLESVSLDDKGLFELAIKGEVALPKSGFKTGRTGKLTLAIDDVIDAQGTSLLRDERCIKQPIWNNANHEPAVTESIFNDKVGVEKKLRLIDGARASDVAAVKGRMAFVSPVQVKRFALPATAGSHIEHMGMRFYVNSVGADGSVSFQLSGDKERFIELRALNKDGLPLQTGGSWSLGSANKRRQTQNFRGKIQSLEIYVAEHFVRHETAFTLKDLFVAPPEKKQSAGLKWLAPEAISPSAWDEYAGINMKKLHADPNDKKFHRFDQNSETLATVTKAPITLELSHKVEKWGNYPMAAVYHPMVPELPGVLSGLSYRIEEPAGEETGVERYARVFYPYFTDSGKVVIEHQINGKPFNREQISLNAGLKENEKLERLKGRLRFRLPTKTASTRLGLDDLWQGKSVDGVTVTVTSIGRGMFPGYELKIEGAIDRLVNLHGLGPEGQRIAADPVNFQDDGYWTMVLPFTPGIREVELVLATAQKVYDFPFDIKPTYPR